MKSAIENPNAFSINAAQLKAAALNNCTLLKVALTHLDKKKEDPNQIMLNYKELITSIEEIINTYENLKTLPEIAQNDLIDQLNTTFIDPPNTYLQSQDATEVSQNPINISSATLLKNLLIRACLKIGSDW